MPPSRPGRERSAHGELRSRETYRGPGRFRHAGTYEVEREWRRYEGTPQRDLLRRVRERFLLRAMARSPPSIPWAVEVGPGPGRFTPLVARGASTVVLFDLSIAMLQGAARRFDSSRGLGGPHRRQLVQGDAARWPWRPGRLDRVVALGNVAGFASQEPDRMLEAMARSLVRGGLLIVETVSPELWAPRFLRSPEWRVGGAAWQGDPARHLPGLLLKGWQRRTPEEGARLISSGFRFIDPREVSRALERAGTHVVEQQVAAPLLGGDPSLLAAVRRPARDPLAVLLRWEEAAGRLPAFLAAGGHLLTCAVRP